eukprot:scaffold2871_cov35-Tisochrysis_lutea.AAC.1
MRLGVVLTALAASAAAGGAKQAGGCEATASFADGRVERRTCIVQVRPQELSLSLMALRNDSMRCLTFLGLPAFRASWMPSRVHEAGLRAALDESWTRGTMPSSRSTFRRMRGGKIGEQGCAHWRPRAQLLVGCMPLGGELRVTMTIFTVAPRRQNLEVSWIRHHNPDLVVLDDMGREKQRIDLNGYDAPRFEALLEAKGFKRKD